MDKILLIEDDLNERKNVQPAIEASIKKFGLQDRVILEVLEKDQIDHMFPNLEDTKTNALEDRLSYFLKNQTDLKLIVIDHDLSQFGNHKLSEPVISVASHAASIPLVRYARISRKNVDNLADAIEAGSEFSIKVDISNHEEAANKIINIYDGFHKIKDFITSMDNQERIKGPSKIMAKLTNADNQEDNFWMYVSGASLLKELIELEEVDNEFFIKDKQQLIIDRLSYVIGYWFYNIILAFPGVILNKTATSSYLNIKESDLNTYHAYFNNAKYQEVFSLTEEYWWKESLDEILDNENVDNGYELLAKDGHSIEQQDTGYYCIMTQKPINFENSRSLSWLPNGAILSRVDEELYDQYAPFFGEY